MGFKNTYDKFHWFSQYVNQTNNNLKNTNEKLEWRWTIWTGRHPHEEMNTIQSHGMIL